MSIIAIIPARAGSKGLKNKNILELCGKPLMTYSIDAAKSNRIDRIIVSTDSSEYADIAKEYGAEVIMRGPEISDDKATAYMVIEDVLSKLEEKPAYFILLQPTSPMRNVIHVEQAMETFEKNMDKYDFLVSVKEADHASVLVKPIEDDLSLKHFNTDFSNYRRQGYREYSPNGAIFMAKPGKYLERKHFFGEKSIAYMMDKVSSVDIDDEVDFELARVLMNKRVNNE